MEGGDDRGVSQFTSGLRSMQTSHRPINMLRCKVVVVGEACVGKTALIQCFHSENTNYPKNYVMTSWVDFCVKEVKIPDTDVAVELYLYDTAGQSIFNQSESDTSYFEHANFVMAVYDVSNKESFDAIQTWLSKARSRRPQLPGVLVANKIDLRGEPGLEWESRAVISREQGLEMARANGLEYFETSAQTQTENLTPFQFIADQFHKKYADTVNTVA